MTVWCGCGHPFRHATDRAIAAAASRHWETCDAPWVLHRTCAAPNCSAPIVAAAHCRKHRTQTKAGVAFTPIRPHIKDPLARIEDALFLRDMGENPERTVARLGTTMTALEKLLRNHGHTWPALTAAINRERSS